MKKLLPLLAFAMLSSPVYSANLSKLFERDFLIGVALPEHVTSEIDRDRAKICAEQFNSLTPENCMKWDATEPQEGKFRFDAADKVVSYARKNKMKVHGHTLVWHNQTPAWVFQGPDGKPATRELVLKRMKTHIETVMKRYKGKVDVWDVVNEAFDEQGRMSNTKWKQTVGDDFIEMAFRYARAADPMAKLCYNDFNMYNPAKRKGVLEVVRKLKKEKLIDLVGAQGHWDVSYPDLNQIEQLIKDCAKIGVQVMITELDIDVLPSAYGLSADLSKTQAYEERFNPYKTGLPEDVAKKQAERYAAIFNLFVKEKKNVYSVTLWGLDDGMSWKNDFPVRGRTNYPLLYDRALKPKPAYDALIKLKTKSTTTGKKTVLKSAGDK